MVTVFEATLRQAATDLDGLGARWAMIGGVAVSARPAEMAQFRPETTLNATTNAEYAAMRVRVVRQVCFALSNDLVANDHEAGGWEDIRDRKLICAE